MSVLEIVILIILGLILASSIFALVWRKKHPKKNDDEDGEES